MVAVSSRSRSRRGCRKREPTKQECVAANDRAQDLRQAGKLRAAREQLALCVAAAARGRCARTALSASPRSPPLSPGSSSPRRTRPETTLESVRVTVDGDPFADRLDGAALDVDPGQHTFRFETPTAPRPRRRSSSARAKEAADGPAGRTSPRRSRPPAGSARPRGAYAAFGAAGASVSSWGPCFGVMALAPRSRRSTPRVALRRPVVPRSDVSTLNTRAWAADIGLGVGVAGGAVGRPCSSSRLAAPRRPARRASTRGSARWPPGLADGSDETRESRVAGPG